MLKVGIIKLISSTWSFPVIIAQKRDEIIYASVSTTGH